LYISPHLARSIRYVSPLIDVATERSPDCVAEVLSLLKIRDVRNIAGLPHVILKEGKAMRISDVASGVAYAAVLGLSMCAANRVYVDEPEAHLHPGMIETLGLMIEKMIRERKIEVAVATQSIEVLDVFTHLDVDGSVLRLKNCSLHDQMTLKEARERIDSFMTTSDTTKVALYFVEGKDDETAVAKWCSLSPVTSTPEIGRVLKQFGRLLGDYVVIIKGLRSRHTPPTCCPTASSPS